MSEYMDRKDRDKQTGEHAEQGMSQEQGTSRELSPTWNEDCLSELDEWIESQGIYIRQ